MFEPLAAAGDVYPLDQPNQLLRNVAGRRFEDVTARAGAAFQLAEVSRGAAFGDVDNDGDTDVLIVNNDGPARLLLNEVGSRAHWLGLRLTDAEGRRDLVGTRVEVVLPDGSSLWRRSRVAATARAEAPRHSRPPRAGAEGHVRAIAVEYATVRQLALPGGSAWRSSPSLGAARS